MINANAPCLNWDWIILELDVFQQRVGAYDMGGDYFSFYQICWQLENKILFSFLQRPGLENIFKIKSKPTGEKKTL